MKKLDFGKVFMLLTCILIAIHSLIFVHTLIFRFSEIGFVTINYIITTIVFVSLLNGYSKNKEHNVK